MTMQLAKTSSRKKRISMDWSQYRHLPMNKEDDEEVYEAKRRQREIDLTNRRKKNLTKSEEEKRREGIYKIILQSNDGIDVVFDSDAAFQSKLIQKMMADLGITDGDHPLLEDPFPIYQVDGWTLKKVHDWCKENRDYIHVEKGPNEDQRVQLTEHEKKYCDVGSDELLKMLLAANFLEIAGLADIICQTIANMAIGKSIREIREVYGIESDLTPEQDEKLQAEADRDVEVEKERRAREEVRQMLGLHDDWCFD